MSGRERRERIDAHQHFWRYDPREHVWMSEQMAALKRDFVPSDLAPLLAASGFSGCVAVQARQSLEETRWLLTLADENPFIRGVVGWVDLRSERLEEELDEFSSRAGLSGVRHVVHDEPDDQFMAGAAFRRGISMLAARGLAYDLLIFPKHLGLATDLAREFPEQRFILDHMAKPDVAGGAMEPWHEGICALAAAPNVSCKVSGLVTEARWNRWAQADFVPYLDAVADAFGPDRLMVGSDWPVCTLSADYANTVGVVETWASRFSESEREGIFGGNCARVYRLGHQKI